MLNCREVSEQMSEYIDGEVSAARRARLAFHLLMCGHCRRFFHQMRLVTQTVGRNEDSALRLDDEQASRIAGQIRRSAEQRTDNNNRKGESDNE
ncbi:MAG: anti-sigma factor family protein [Pseudomonadota bacterium]